MRRCRTEIAPLPGEHELVRDFSVLVVEDDLGLAKQHLESLERLGIAKLHLAINLAAAHQICAGHPISSVVMDYNLSSGVDTYEFGQFLRQNTRLLVTFFGIMAQRRDMSSLLSISVKEQGSVYGHVHYTDNTAPFLGQDFSNVLGDGIRIDL